LSGKIIGRTRNAQKLFQRAEIRKPLHDGRVCLSVQSSRAIPIREPGILPYLEKNFWYLKMFYMKE
jgi:hypothetical protein